MVSGEPLPGDSLLARLGQGNVGTLRIDLAWGSVQAGPGAAYDWSHYDPVIASAAQHGIRVLATVYSSPTWAESTPEHPPLGSALPGFEAFVRAAAHRYGANGTFWTQHSQLPKLPITDWQLWNEPNSGLFWKPKPDAGQYLTLLRAFNAAIKGVDPGAEILLTGLFPTPAHGVTTERFLTDLYQGGGGGLFDAVAVHPYASTPQRVLPVVEDARTLMSRFGDAEKPIWITEIGWASGGDPSSITVGTARQAEYLTQTFQLAAANRTRLRIAGVIWYSLSDLPGSTWVSHSGLFTIDDSPKPSWDALVQLTGGTP